MKLYVGGAFQGQRECAERETGRRPRMVTTETAMSAPAIDNFHELLRGMTPDEARAFAVSLIKNNPDVVVVCDEIGLGIVPYRPEDRMWREAVGRAVCTLAQASEAVTRVTCGLAQRIKSS